MLRHATGALALSVAVTVVTACGGGGAARPTGNTLSNAPPTSPGTTVTASATPSTTEPSTTEPSTPTTSPTGTSQTSPGGPGSATAAAPSQSAVDAARDGVVPALAALPFAVRVHVLQAVPTSQGVWALSRPTAAADAYAQGCRLGPETGMYPTETICTREYGEVLLLDASRSRILRAYPLPSVPATFLRVTGTAVYCARTGDTTLSEYTLPDTMVCRVDRQTLRAQVRVFVNGEESEVAQPCFNLPAGWTTVDQPLAVTDLQVDDRGVWTRSRDGLWTDLDATALTVRARGVQR